MCSFRAWLFWRSFISLLDFVVPSAAAACATNRTVLETSLLQSTSIQPPQNWPATVLQGMQVPQTPTREGMKAVESQKKKIRSDFCLQQWIVCIHLNCYSFRIYKVTHACNVVIFQGWRLKTSNSWDPTGAAWRSTPGSSCTLARAVPQLGVGGSSLKTLQTQHWGSHCPGAPQKGDRRASPSSIPFPGGSPSLSPHTRPLSPPACPLRTGLRWRHLIQEGGGGGGTPKKHPRGCRQAAGEARGRAGSGPAATMAVICFR